MRNLTGSPFIDDWVNVDSVMIYVDNNVRFGKEIVEGLPHKPKQTRKAHDNARKQTGMGRMQKPRI